MCSWIVICLREVPEEPGNLTVHKFSQLGAIAFKTVTVKSSCMAGRVRTEARKTLAVSGHVIGWRAAQEGHSPPLLHSRSGEATH